MTSLSQEDKVTLDSLFDFVVPCDITDGHGKCERKAFIIGYFKRCCVETPIFALICQFHHSHFLRCHALQYVDHHCVYGCNTIYTSCFDRFIESLWTPL